MEARPVSAVWGGQDRDVLTVLAARLPDDYLADPSDDDDDVVFYRTTDEHGEATGEIIGIEVLDFLDFNNWDALPALAESWQLADWESLPLVDLLKQLQLALRAQSRTPVRA